MDVDNNLSGLAILKACRGSEYSNCPIVPYSDYAMYTDLNRQLHFNIQERINR